MKRMMMIVSLTVSCALIHATEFQQHTHKILTLLQEQYQKNTQGEPNVPAFYHSAISCSGVSAQPIVNGEDITIACQVSNSKENNDLHKALYEMAQVTLADQEDDQMKNSRDCTAMLLCCLPGMQASYRRQGDVKLRTRGVKLDDNTTLKIATNGVYTFEIMAKAKMLERSFGMSYVKQDNKSSSDLESTRALAGSPRGSLTSSQHSGDQTKESSRTASSDHEEGAFVVVTCDDWAE